MPPTGPGLTAGHPTQIATQVGGSDFYLHSHLLLPGYTLAELELRKGGTQAHIIRIVQILKTENESNLWLNLKLHTSPQWPGMQPRCVWLESLMVAPAGSWNQEPGPGTAHSHLSNRWLPAPQAVTSITLHWRERWPIYRHVRPSHSTRKAQPLL